VIGRIRVVAGLALLAALLIVASPTGATLVKKPVTKGLGSGAIFQGPLGKRSCYGSAASVSLGRQRCTLIAELDKADPTIPPAVASDSRALYIASQGGVVILKRDSSGGLSFGSCAVIAGACGAIESGDASVTQLVVGPGGRQLYVVLVRRDATEIHALAIGAGDGLAPDPSCLLLAIAQQYSTPENPRNCRVDLRADHASTYGLAFTPDGRFAYAIDSGTGSGVLEMARGADGSLTVLPGCVSTTGTRSDSQTDTCETVTPTPKQAGQNLNVEQLVATPDSSGLVLRGNDSHGDHVGGFVVRFSIGADGGLTRSRAPTGCVNATGINGCYRSPALLGLMSPIAVVGKRVYLGSSDFVNGTLGIHSNVLGYELAGDGGLSLPAGAAGCVGNTTEPAKPIRKLGACSLGREAMRHPLSLLAGPRGNTLYVVGHMEFDSLGIALLRLGAGGAPAPVSGPTGCFLDGGVYATEKTPCNHPFVSGTETLHNSEATLALSPDGRFAYVIDQPPRNEFARLNVLQQRP
jgi:DNA-binding beta-propeller fold protein YncE